MRVNTNLPIFNGFMETIWELKDLDLIPYSDFPWDDIDFDMEAYEESVARALCVEVKLAMKNFINDIQFHSVKYFDHINDAILVSIDYKQEEVQHFCIDNFDVLDNFLKDNYIPPMGQASPFPETFDAWCVATEGFSNFEKPMLLEAVLRSIASYYNITEKDLHTTLKDQGVLDLGRFITKICDAKIDVSDISEVAEELGIELSEEQMHWILNNHQCQNGEFSTKENLIHLINIVTISN